MYRSFGFCEDWYSENHISRRGISEFLPIILHFFTICMKFSSRYVHKNLMIKYEFHVNYVSESLTYLSEASEFVSVLPTFGAQSGRSAHNVFGHV